MADNVKLDITELDKLIRLFKNDKTVTRVGVLSTTTARSGEGSEQNDNASVGAASEFGTTKTVRRSWLRVPLIENFSQYLEKTELITDSLLAETMKSGKLSGFMRIIGKIAEKVVSDGFQTAGFGKWAMWKNGYTNRTGQILIDTTQLSKSVTSDVK